MAGDQREAISHNPIVTKLRPALLLLAVLTSGATSARAQSLSFLLFERYLESLREEAGIPGLSAAVVQNGAIVWERGFGRQDVEGAVAATPSTPYLLGGLSQTLGSTMILRKCLDESHAELTDRVRRWVSSYGDETATLKHLLTHTTPSGDYTFDLRRFGDLTGVLEQCASLRYSTGLAREVFDRLGMTDAVPGLAMASPSPSERQGFDAGRLAQYAATLQRLATPYRVDRSRRAQRSDRPAADFDVATGAVASVRDLARFDAALSDGVLLRRGTLEMSWSQAVSGAPTGLGWFVQAYNGEPLIWQFGLVKDAYSALILKVPNRRLTLILLANSDGLSAPFGLEKGDVTTSLFATTFLRLLVQ